MGIKLVIICFLSLPLLTGPAMGQRRSSLRQPNIILILADDLGYGDLGCYGQTKIRTPNLDRMASEGMRFTQFYAGNAVCAPSRCSLLTGRHMGHAPIRGNLEKGPMVEGQQPMPRDTTTVAHSLNEAGYATGLVGKWGLLIRDWPGTAFDFL